MSYSYVKTNIIGHQRSLPEFFHQHLMIIKIIKVKNQYLKKKLEKVLRN